MPDRLQPLLYQARDRGRVLIPAVLGGLLSLNILMGWHWSREPAQPDLIVAAQPVPGEATTQALINVMTTLLEKPGGYLSNDILPHRLWLDNMPNWEYGALTQARDLSRALQKELGRPRGVTLVEDPDLRVAAPQLAFDHKSWAFPSAEREYRRGIRALERYLVRRREGQEAEVPASFHLDPAALDFWLAEVHDRLKALSRELSGSVGRPLPDAGLLDDESVPLSRTPRFQVDDVFYQARGSTWALLHLMRGAEQDFGRQLTPSGRVHLRRVIHQLEYTQAPVRSPVILNGRGFGLFANHSLVMANHIAGANLSLQELRASLYQVDVQVQQE
ncbi:DUF2333 family protein [Isoalcanivorax indicus]|uniref:DUF2333 family protein n=1 Tax=Isoalcanivorax indicus TaxID=2202653 RepID=UPI0013C50053|nr:DUF2333 family protein [Isoalcanivorax indicus]